MISRKIYGPPGTGKTTRLINYAKTFYKLGTPLDKIGYFAFTKKAANEAKERMLKIYPQYGATKTPHIYILEKTSKGNEVKYIGAIDDNYKDASQVNEKYVEDAVDALLKDEEVKVKETRAIGCTIKV